MKLMEDLTFLSTLVSLLCLLSYLLLRISYSLWWKPKWIEKSLKQQGIKGTPYKVLIGDMRDFVKQITEAWSKPISLSHQIVPRVDPFTYNVVQKYGNISFSWNGSTPRLIIKDPELIREVLSNKKGHIQKPPLNPLILILGRGLTALEGEKWATHRRIINPAFYFDKLKGMVPILAESCSLLIEKWKNSVAREGTGEIDVWPEFHNLTGDIISRTAFGSNYQDGNKILELQKELQKLVFEAMTTVYVPGFRFIPTKKNRRRKYLDRSITAMLRILIETKEDLMRTGNTRSDDLLGMLLQSNNQNNLPANGSQRNDRMTLEDIIEECKIFYLAGHETTLSLLTWTMIILSMHQTWQDKARVEVLQECGRTCPDAEAVSHLKIVTMILYEVLRLYPPIIALYQHAYKLTKIGNLTLPAGVDLTLPILLINHDPELWGDDAEEFNPERFSEGVSKASNAQMAFFPFGWGPRTCIGQNFAMIEAKVAVCMILQHFTFELSPSYSHAPNTLMTLQPQHGAQIMVHRL